jgi:hypothetical protein
LAFALALRRLEEGARDAEKKWPRTVAANAGLITFFAILVQAAQHTVTIADFPNRTSKQLLNHSKNMLAIARSTIQY